MAHILFLEWSSFGNEYLKRAWEKNGDTYECFPFSTKEDTRLGEELTKSIVMKVMQTQYDYIFSFNFFPVAAMAAYACRVRYVAWVYDNPYAQLYSQTVMLPTNDICIFDRHEVEMLQKKGVKTVRYLPLAADVDYYDSFPQNGDREYAADISFVGALYTEERQQLYRRFDSMPSYEKGYLDGLLQMQMKIYGENLLEDAIAENPELLGAMQEAAPLQPHPDAFATQAWYYANFHLCRQVTAMERTKLLAALAECKEYSLKVYTSKEAWEASSSPLKECCRLPVDYYHKAPLVYKNSKINLNITLKSIQTGIPLRCFDIMGCGGFLLTNYQADFFSDFIPDVDFVYYQDEKDLLRKVDYYLSHDEKREEIAGNGYEKVKRLHTYIDRVKAF